MSHVSCLLSVSVYSASPIGFVCFGANVERFVPADLAIRVGNGGWGEAGMPVPPGRTNNVLMQPRYTLSLTHTHTHTNTYRTHNTHTHTHSLTHSLTRSLTHSLGRASGRCLSCRAGPASPLCLTCFAPPTIPNSNSCVWRCKSLNVGAKKTNPIGEAE